MDIIISLIALVGFIGIMAFAISLGLALFGVIVISGLALGAFIVLRGYYLRWKYGQMPQHQETVTVIETEYTDISDR